MPTAEEIASLLERATLLEELAELETRQAADNLQHARETRSYSAGKIDVQDYMALKAVHVQESSKRNDRRHLIETILIA